MLTQWNILNQMIFKKKKRWHNKEGERKKGTFKKKKIFVEWTSVKKKMQLVKVGITIIKQVNLNKWCIVKLT